MTYTENTPSRKPLGDESANLRNLSRQNSNVTLKAGAVGKQSDCRHQSTQTEFKFGDLVALEERLEKTERQLLLESQANEELAE